MKGYLKLKELTNGDLFMFKEHSHGTYVRVATDIGGEELEEIGINQEGEYIGVGKWRYADWGQEEVYYYGNIKNVNKYVFDKLVKNEGE